MMVTSVSVSSPADTGSRDPSPSRDGGGGNAIKLCYSCSAEHRIVLNYT